MINKAGGVTIEEGGVNKTCMFYVETEDYTDVEDLIAKVYALGANAVILFFFLILPIQLRLERFFIPRFSFNRMGQF